MLDPEGALVMLKLCSSLMSPGGQIIVQAQYLNDDRTSPRWPALLNLMLRVATPDGRNHTIGETAEWLREAGFTEVRHVPFSLWSVCSCLTARKPS